MGNFNRPLSGKKILLLAPFFYKYEVAIANKLEFYGAEVVYYDADPSQLYSNFLLACKKKGLWHKELSRYFENKLYDKIKDAIYDCVLVICGSNITSWLVEKVRHSLLKRGGKMYLYHWDSLNNLQDDNNRWSCFDKRYTFDKQDSLNYPEVFEFLPLFYCDEYNVISTDKQKQIYDIAIVGSFTVYRYSLLNSIKITNPEINIYFKLFAKKRVVWIYKLVREKYCHVNLEDLMYRKMDAKEITQIYNQSSSVIDLPYFGQSGQTIRMIECMAMRKKVITTNTDVVNYDFYNPENIFILNDDMLLPNKKWFLSQFVPINDDVLHKYSIDSWIKRIFKNEFNL